MQQESHLLGGRTVDLRTPQELSHHIRNLSLQSDRCFLSLRSLQQNGDRLMKWKNDSVSKVVCDR